MQGLQLKHWKNYIKIALIIIFISTIDHTAVFNVKKVPLRFFSALWNLSASFSPLFWFQGRHDFRVPLHSKTFFGYCYFTWMFELRWQNDVCAECGTWRGTFLCPHLKMCMNEYYFVTSQVLKPICNLHRCDAETWSFQCTYCSPKVDFWLKKRHLMSGS